MHHLHNLHTHALHAYTYRPRAAYTHTRRTQTVLYVHDSQPVRCSCCPEGRASLFSPPQNAGEPEPSLESMPVGLLGWNVATLGPRWPREGCWLGLRPWSAEIEQTLHARRTKISVVIAVLHIAGSCSMISPPYEHAADVLALTAASVSVIVTLVLLGLMFIATDPIRSRSAGYFMFSGFGTVCRFLFCFQTASAETLYNQ